MSDTSEGGMEQFAGWVYIATVLVCVLAIISAWVQSLLAVPLAVGVFWFSHVQLRNIRALSTDTDQ